MNELIKWLIYLVAIVVAPPLCIGIIRKTKARLQNRIGAPIHQPLVDLIKMFRKFETVSTLASFALRGAAAGNAGVTLLIACTVPWIPAAPALMHADLFLIIYLFVLLRFFTIIASLDTGSPFGGFGAAREIVLPILVEPGVMLCLVSLAIVGRTSDLTSVFSFDTHSALATQPGLWILAGCGLYLASLVELSRMPADDPTTHLELTMVHEAMLVENSGPNLALTEYAHALKLMVLMGMSGQCLIHGLPGIWNAEPPAQVTAGAVSILFLLILTAVIEGSGVKLRWTKLPEFIAYAVTFGLLCAVFVLGV
jgi:formate hydrogenlyase subunit 4